VIPISDTQFEEHVLDKVTRTEGGWEIQYDKCICFFCPDVGIEPKVGDVARYYGEGIGRPIRGLEINGHVVFYRTEAQECIEQELRRVRREQELREEYAQKKDDYAARIAQLPAPFQARLARLASKRDNFGWEFLPYDLFVCEQAVAFAQALGTREAITAFRKADGKTQQQLVPALSDQHSGNTFGYACYLAGIYLDKPEALKFTHGALVGLVGCEGYGCHPLTPDEEQEIAKIK